ncbi:MAG: TetR/AcrR family transcriptional regulator [bacterium]|nr:TetR/AcrR family transcriptional regulator [bacterium]
MTLEESIKNPASEDPRIAHTRKVVLAAAIDLLKSEGHEAVTPLRIAERTGIARTTIYRHWPERRDLIADAIEEHKPDWGIESCGDLSADLTMYLGKMVARLTSGPLPQFFVTLIERAEHDEEFADMHCRMAEHRSQPIVAVLEAAIARGELPKDLDVPAAIAAINGPVFYRRLITREPLTDSFIATIVDGFLARFN